MSTPDAKIARSAWDQCALIKCITLIYETEKLICYTTIVSRGFTASMFVEKLGGKAMMCMSITKDLLIQIIEQYGAEAVTKDTQGMTDAECIESIQNDSREVFTGCDNYDEKGYCKGHDK